MEIKKWFVGIGILKIKCEPSWKIQEGEGERGLSREIEKIFFMNGEEKETRTILGEKSGDAGAKGQGYQVMNLAPLRLMLMSWSVEKKHWGSTHYFLLNNED